MTGPPALAVFLTLVVGVVLAIVLPFILFGNWREGLERDPDSGGDA